MSKSENSQQGEDQENVAPESEQNEEGAQQAQAESGAESGAEAGNGEAEDTVKLLEDARAKADEHWDLYMRTQAEMENLRRRGERDLANAHKFGIERFVQELLPVKDSMELGLGAAQGDGEEMAKLREGMELTLKMLSGALEKNGVEAIDPQGQPFNPEYHQAMSMAESAEVEPNTVLAVMQKGYLLNQRLVRPAMVVVSKASAAGENPGATLDEQV